MKRKSCAKIAIAIWLSAVFLTIAVRGAVEAGFRINETPSVAVGLWRLKPLDRPLRRDDIVSVCPPETPIFQMAFERRYLAQGACPNGWQAMLKPVAAIVGDIVAIASAGISVNGIRLQNSNIRTFDRKGRPMPVSHCGETVAGPDQVWLVSGAKAESFDSRYFGPVSIDAIEGLAFPVWTWMLKP